ncbi:MAG: hypothetical protein M3342_24285 [Bacteroidota bacterium]|nr:hypothetical protein [Bacteroidota bacterium]
MKRFIPLLLILAVGCVPDAMNRTEQLMSFVPVYASKQVVSDIAVQAPKPTSAAGKIYAYGAYLFQVEQYEGIHIIDNTNPRQAKKIAFLKVPLCTEIAIRNNHLYTNNLNDLLVFNLDNTTAPQLVKRLGGVFPAVNQTYPPQSGVYFECVDPAKGIVVRWEQKRISNPACRR